MYYITTYKPVWTASEHSTSVGASQYECVKKASKTLNSGYLGSRNDEERSEMRYVV